MTPASTRASRGAREITIAFTPEFPLAQPRRTGRHASTAICAIVPREYASAMTWYRVAFAGGYDQAPMLASPWSYGDQLPEPLHWAWVADNGDLITRVGKGLFRMSFANSHNNWFQEVDCRLLAWPEGNAEAPMTCNDGKQRTMQVPATGSCWSTTSSMCSVFDSEETTLPPPEVIPDEKLTPERAGRRGSDRGVDPAARGSGRGDGSGPAKRSADPAAAR